MGEFVKNNKGVKIWTDNGWSNFSGIVNNGTQSIIEIIFDNNKSIRCTADHQFYTSGLKKVYAKDLVGAKVISNDGEFCSVVEVKDSGKTEVYDITDVDYNNRFFANDVLVSNCEFIIYDETLISPLLLSEMESSDTVMKQGQIRWFELPKPGNLYLVALDPSLGTGGDNAAIQVFCLQGLRQVAEWMHNRTPIIQQVAILREITRYLADKTGDMNNIYYTVENNTLGEAALQQIAEIGEENIDGYFMTEPAHGVSKRYRKGFNTTNSKKLAACAKLKHWLETRKMKIHSKPLISELKTFVSAGAGYAAKLGEKDDLVSATLLIVRMAILLKQYDSDAHAELKDEIDTIIEPMPFVII